MNEPNVVKEWQGMAAIADTMTPPLAGTRLADYLQLTRPRLSAMALLTVAAGALLASAGAPDWRILARTLVGAAPWRQEPAPEPVAGARE